MANSKTDSLASLRTIPSNVSEYSLEPSHHEEEDEEALEHDPSGRFGRFRQEVGKGRFKHVYKGFDEKQGIDVAWSKIQQEVNHLDEAQMLRVVEQMSKGLQLDHPNIIRCYRCWMDSRDHCINLITEYFTSGNLRDYRQRHKHLELKAVKKWAKQILLGLDYLHMHQPPLVHGDLRCDKIYINGHSGEIKIGDLGLSALLPRRFPPEVLKAAGNSDKDNQYTQEVDIFAFGLCTLELATCRKLDNSNYSQWPKLLADYPDAEARAFIGRCLESGNSPRPSAAQLLEDAFFAKKLAHADGSKAKSEADLMAGGSGVPLGGLPERGYGDAGPGESDVDCQVGTCRGEDYTFSFTGKVKEGKLHFRLQMEYIGDDEDANDSQREGNGSRTIDFVYDPDVDTPDAVSSEIGNEFNLSSTDRDICGATLKEWLAKELPS